MILRRGATRLQGGEVSRNETGFVWYCVGCGLYNKHTAGIERTLGGHPMLCYIEMLHLRLFLSGCLRRNVIILR